MFKTHLRKFLIVLCSSCFGVHALAQRYLCLHEIPLHLEDKKKIMHAPATQEREFQQAKQKKKQEPNFRKRNRQTKGKKNNIKRITDSSKTLAFAFTNN